MAQDEDSFVKADEEVRKTSEDVAPNSGTTTGRQRKKRKWDQPAESLVSAGLVIPGAQHYAVPGITGSAASVSGFVPAVTIPTSFVSTPHLQPSAVQHTAVAIVQKINQDLATKGLLAQPKIQDEVIAREIVINDADPTVRYKLTKRQTQEEIQAKTGAVVITRGKYRPPNGPIENEKPLYLHISSGAHLKDLAERIRAVDLAALMVEEIMKQGRLMPATSNVHSLVGQGTTPCSISVFVGVEADPTFNLVGRIRGPNDQYINHIMNETGATVILRGRGSGSCEGANDEEAQQPLHLFISSDNVKNLESAKALADSLLETVRSEYFASRSLPYQVASTIPTADLVAPTPLYQAASYSPSTPYAGLYPQAVVSYSHIPPNTFSPTSSIPQRPSINSNPVVSTGSFNSATKAYNAVPPPLHLLSETTVGRTETQKTDSVSKDLNPQGFTSSSTLFPCQPAPISSTLQNINDSKSVASVVASEIPITHQSKAGTNYSGYGGIYPQATPLQQVALALQRPPPPVSIQPASANGQPTKAHLCHSNGQSDKHPEKRRKFQELPVASKDHPKEVQNGSQGTDYKSAEALEKVATNQFKSSGSHVFESSSSRSMSSVDAKLMPPPPAKTASTLPLETTLMPPPKTTLMPPPKTALMQPPKTPIMPSPRTVTLPLPTSTLDASLKAMSPKETEQFSELGLKDSASKVEAGIRLVEYGEDDEDSDNDG